MLVDEEARRQKPIIPENLTIKDIVDLVGQDPLEVRIENKWIVLQFDRSQFKLKNYGRRT
jgi:hypothetical protein